MKSLVLVNICIVLLHIIILVNLTNAELGDSSCRYSGSFDSDNELCHSDVVKIDKLPEACTAYVFDGVVCNQDYNIVYRRVPQDLDHLRSLIEFDDSKHSVYLFYKHQTIEEWSKALFFGNFLIEAQKVNDFIANYPVKGLILDGIEEPVIENDGDFYKNFTAYVTAIKSKNPILDIGFYLSARTLVDSVNVGNNSNSTWFDFSVMNSVLDFYIIEFATFNVCSDDFLHGGITPFDSSDPAIMTLNKFSAALKLCTIDKEKVYFEFLIRPEPKPEEVENFKPCEFSYNEYCENHDDYFGIWCVDNQDILYKKGQFAKQYSKGFIARDIDLVDRDEKCHCDNKYITFYMLLEGYNSIKDPLTCKAFD